MEPLRHATLPGQNNLEPSSMAPGYGPSAYEQVRTAQRKAQAAPNTWRIVVRGVALVAAASIIGVLAHASAVWSSTREVIQTNPNGYRLRAWPVRIDLWPTWVMLGAAVIAVVVQTLSLLTFCGPFRRLRETNFHSVAVFCTSLLGIAAWIAAAVYFKLQDSRGKNNWGLWSWSCANKSLQNGKMSFATMCVEMNYTFYASVIVAVLEIVSLGIFGHLLYKFHREGKGYSKITVQKI